MPLDPGDRYYRAEQISPTIAAMEAPLCKAFGVGLDHFGSKGNTVHTSGYHRSRNWILHSPDSAHGSGDYSIQLAADKTGNGDDISAFDFTPGAWGTADNRAKMRAMTQRLLTACQRRDPRVANLREFAGTLDGSHVVTWDCSRNAFKAPFDSSHLDHVHGSIYRSKTRADHSGIVSVLIGESMAEWTQDQINNVVFTTTGIIAPDGTRKPLHVALGEVWKDVEALKVRPAATVTLDAGQLDALASAIAAKLGHVPTAQETAQAVIAEIAS